MSRKLPKDNGCVTEKKERSLARLKERYYGKKDLLDTWDTRSGIEKNNDYRNDLKRRVQTHKNDMIYRGAL
jgi:hypothetical protein